MARKPQQPSGVALFSYGFRPFFLCAAVFAAISIPVWLLAYDGRLVLPTAFPAREWHIHEFFFGYLAAVITGFLFTAIPNWTGRLPLRGPPLMILAGLWLAGRVAMFWPSVLGWGGVMLVDAGFLAAVVAVVTIEIVAGKNWRNLTVLAPVALLLVSNIGFHLEIQVKGDSEYATRAAFSAVLVLIMLIGGRIIPSFTRNWLVRENPGRLPVPLNRFDIASILIALVALTGWTLLPDVRATGLLLIGAAVLQAVRLARWAGDRTWRSPLLLALHVAYAFVPLGLLAEGVHILAPGLVASATGVHLFGIGAMGGMTLAVMTRASLGHTGQALVAGKGLTAVFALLLISVLVRVWVSQSVNAGLPALYLSGFAWTAAFAGFVMLIGPGLAGRQTKPNTGTKPVRQD